MNEFEPLRFVLLGVFKNVWWVARTPIWFCLGHDAYMFCLIFTDAISAHPHEAVNSVLNHFQPAVGQRSWLGRNFPKQNRFDHVPFSTATSATGSSAAGSVVVSGAGVSKKLNNEWEK